MPERVQCLHLLVKHRDSRRPSSWKNPNITISKEEAIQQLEGYQSQLNGLSGSELIAKFSELAASNSDCSSARSGGDLGMFDRGKMQKAFEDASFALQEGQMSGIVSTDSGVHLILRVK